MDQAPDIISFSVERPKLRANGDKAIMECNYESLKVEHMADLLKIVHDIAPWYATPPLLALRPPITPKILLGTRRIATMIGGLLSLPSEHSELFVQTGLSNLPKRRGPKLSKLSARQTLAQDHKKSPAYSLRIGIRALLLPYLCTPIRHGVLLLSPSDRSLLLLLGQLL